MGSSSRESGSTGGCRDEVGGIGSGGAAGAQLTVEAGAVAEINSKQAVVAGCTVVAVRLGSIVGGWEAARGKTSWGWEVAGGKTSGELLRSRRGWIRGQGDVREGTVCRAGEIPLSEMESSAVGRG